jgi:o-succinylbenzoate synthase
MLVSRVRTRKLVLDNTTLRTTYGSNVAQREHVFVSIQTTDGTEGFGEGSPLPHFSGERAKEMDSVIRDVFGPALLGCDSFDLERAVLAMDRALPHHQASKAALVSALVDLQGKLTGRPAYQLLGGKLTDAIPVAGAVGIEEPAQVSARVEDLIDRGVRTFKLKVGADVDRDVRTVNALRDRFGMDIELRADANAGFTQTAALRFIQGVADARLQYLEQPLPSQDLRGLARLRSRSTVPIAVDESLFGVEDALGIIQHEAADVFIIKLIKLGGLHNARKVVALAEAAGITCVAVSPYETALGVSANLHLAVGSTAFRFAAELGVGVSEVRLAGVPELEYRAGTVTIPSAPGLGVRLPADFFETSASTAQV